LSRSCGDGGDERRFERCVQVLVDAPAAGGVFAYRLPPSVGPHVRRGTRVIVPFGGRTVEGYIVGAAPAPEDIELKEVRAILADEPVVPPDLLDLATWLADRYLCDPAHGLRCVLPPGVKRRRRRVLRASRRLLESEQAARGALSSLRNAPGQRTVLEALLRSGESSPAELKRLLGRDPSGLLSSLRRKGFVEDGDEVVTRARRRTVLVAGLAVPRARAEAEADRLERTAPRQAEVLRELVRRGDACPASELSNGPGDRSGAVRRLAARGLVELRARDVARSPRGPRCSDRPGENVPTRDQENVLQLIAAGLGRGGAKYLLFGVPASGKTEIYLRAAEDALGRGSGAVVLVPEIALAPQTVARFKSRFGERVAILHSALSAGERYDEWRRVRSGGARVVVGARSAVFAPLSDLGLLVIDEEHESSYKQETGVRYHARDVAVERARREGACVLLGSATPSVESYWGALNGEYELLRLPARIGGRSAPRVNVVDMREEMKSGHRSIFSRALLEMLAERLSRSEQALLFLNRRGHSTFVLCRECGHVARCSSCDVSLTFHAVPRELRCHHCGARARPPERCPVCGSPYIRHFGVGTQRVEAEVASRFPGARVLRMDRDTTRRRGSHEEIWRTFAAGDADVLVGTQMVAKGLDLPRVTLVGIVTADTCLNLPDFRAAERTFQLLTQAAGRAGRGDLGGEVVVQTYRPDHYAVEAAAAGDYERFYSEEIEYRRALGYPPFARLALARFEARSDDDARRAATEFAEEAGARAGADVQVLGPAPAPLRRIRGNYRWQVLLRAEALDRLVDTLRAAEPWRGRRGGIRASLDVDPYSML